MRIKQGAGSKEQGARPRVSRSLYLRALRSLRPAPGSLPPAPRGFSLAEVLLAIAITAFALLALIGVLPEGLRSLQSAQRHEAEARIIQHLSAKYQSKPWSDFAQLSTSQDITDFDANGTFLDKGGRDVVYRARVEVMNGTELPNETSASPYLKRIRIRIVAQTGANASFEDPNRYHERYVTLVDMDKSPNTTDGAPPTQNSADPSSAGSGNGTTTNP